jgi:hypothetical protein
MRPFLSLTFFVGTVVSIVGAYDGASVATLVGLVVGIFISVMNG